MFASFRKLLIFTLFPSFFFSFSSSNRIFFIIFPHFSHDLQVENVIVDYTIDFIEATCNFDAGGSVRSAIEFNTRDKIFTEEWIPQSLGLVIYGEILSGNFYLANPLRSIPSESPVKFVTLKEEFTPDQTENCIKWASFNSKLLNKLIRKLDEEDRNDEVDSGVIDCLAELPYMLNYILLIASLGHVYSFHYKSVSFNIFCFLLVPWSRCFTACQFIAFPIPTLFLLLLFFSV